MARTARADLADFAGRGVAIADAGQPAPTAALCWGMAVAAYPFFGKVAEIVGRLCALQGGCTVAEVHRSGGAGPLDARPPPA